MIASCVIVIKYIQAHLFDWKPIIYYVYFYLKMIGKIEIRKNEMAEIKVKTLGNFATWDLAVLSRKGKVWFRSKRPVTTSIVSIMCWPAEHRRNPIQASHSAEITSYLCWHLTNFWGENHHILIVPFRAAGRYKSQIWLLNTTLCEWLAWCCVTKECSVSSANKLDIWRLPPRFVTYIMNRPVSIKVWKGLLLQHHSVYTSSVLAYVSTIRRRRRKSS
jgi:hypothetical protein